MGDDSVPFFDETRVPIEAIELTAPEAEGVAPEDYEVIGHKESFQPSRTRATGNSDGPQELAVQLD